MFDLLDRLVPRWVQENLLIFSFIVLILLVALIGLLIYLRRQQEEE